MVKYTNWCIPNLDPLETGTVLRGDNWNTFFNQIIGDSSPRIAKEEGGDSLPHGTNSMTCLCLKTAAERLYFYFSSIRLDICSSLSCSFANRQRDKSPVCESFIIAAMGVAWEESTSKCFRHPNFRETVMPMPAVVDSSVLATSWYSASSWTFSALDNAEVVDELQHLLEVVSAVGEEAAAHRSAESVAHEGGEVVGRLQDAHLLQVWLRGTFTGTIRRYSRSSMQRCIQWES